MKFFLTEAGKQRLKDRLADIVIEYADEETRCLAITTTNVKSDIKKHLIPILKKLIEDGKQS